MRGNDLQASQLGRRWKRRKPPTARQPTSAVGVAVGRNPVSIIVPCHRVVGSTGSLTGYSGGVDRKLALLGLEGVDVSRLTVPTRGTAL